nr:CMF_HP1_G0048510.mRNA.1.CDS.1 [Saccharomyces cerevisiae]
MRSGIPYWERGLLSKLLQNPMVNNRFEWQTMLSKVLRGDIVRNEKTKIGNQGKGPGFNTQFSDDIWIELKAWMKGGRGRSEQISEDFQGFY